MSKVVCTPITDEGAYNPKLQCHWRRIDVTMDSIVAIHIADDHATDFSGTVELITGIMPDVLLILVISGKLPQVVYFLTEDNEWASEPYPEAGHIIAALLQRINK